MLTLYTKHSCAFSAMVIHRLEELGLSFEEKHITDPAVADELYTRSGSHATPYLVDSDTGKELYASEPIVAYLNEWYST
jgi:glutaredoxin